MNRIRIATLILMLPALLSTAWAQLGLGNARLIGMGGAYAPIVDDGTALMINPAGMDALNYNVFTGTFGHLYPGVDPTT